MLTGIRALADYLPQYIYRLTIRWWDLDSPRGCQSLWFSCSAGWNLRLRTQRLRTSTRNTENTASLYWFGPPGSKTLRPVVGVDCLRIAYCTRGRLIRLILASGWGRFPDSWSITTKRPKSTLHLLPYPIDLLWLKSTEFLSCTPSLEVVLN
jgi:hypothetical protein